MSTLKINNKNTVIEFGEQYFRGTHYDVNGVLLPNVKGTVYENAINGLLILDSFGHHLGYSNEYLENMGGEGNYIYERDIYPGDIVIDAGAFIGDFSAYAAYKGATVYAFEPSKETFKWLIKTAELNPSIHPIPLGLSDKCRTIRLFRYRHYNGMDTTEFKKIIEFMFFRRAGVKYPSEAISPFFNIDKIKVITLDSFVVDNDIHKVDYIKADIEGAERYMLMGATNTLKTMAPELSICTYHLSDDREVLTNLIKKANPGYKIVYGAKKLHAWVPRI